MARGLAGTPVLPGVDGLNGDLGDLPMGEPRPETANPPRESGDRSATLKPELLEPLWEKELPEPRPTCKGAIKQ